MISRLRHHGAPGLHAQKYDSTENSSASTMVIGTTLAMVWPNISMTSRGRVDIAASSERAIRLSASHLRSGEPKPAQTGDCNKTGQIRVLRDDLKLNLPC